MFLQVGSEEWGLRVLSAEGEFQQGNDRQNIGAAYEKWGFFDEMHSLQKLL